MKTIIFFPFLLQAAAIFVDEIYFHIRRGLPRWERIGHPIDTATVLICLLFVLLVPYSSYALRWYISLSLFSCAMITKDEWVHKEHCPALENWLHALLFLNHPLVLSLVALFWWSSSFPQPPSSWLPNSGLLHSFLLIQASGIAFFMSYQIFYWNFLVQPSLISILDQNKKRKSEEILQENLQEETFLPSFEKVEESQKISSELEPKLYAEKKDSD
jgi:hypothetical protein